MWTPELETTYKFPTIEMTIDDLEGGLVFKDFVGMVRSFALAIGYQPEIINELIINPYGAPSSIVANDDVDNDID